MYELVVVIEITILHLNIKKVNASCRFMIAIVWTKPTVFKKFKNATF